MDVSFIEILWTLVALAGAIIQSFLIHDTWLDRRAAQRLGRNGDVRRLLGSQLRSGAIALFIHFLFLAVGISAVAVPNADQPMTAVRFISISMLIAGAVALVLNGWLDLRSRRELRADLAEGR